ncbi:hypothetical protein OB920_05885 [Halobacteria archaeon HArc-gm2]|nr:hypothetical protein [Halobacteria archaeon HArc-gm2]
MSDVTSRPVDRHTSQLTVGALAFLSAGLSVAIYAVSGEWPAGFWGLEAVFFVVLGVVLVGYTLAARL